MHVTRASQPGGSPVERLVPARRSQPAVPVSHERLGEARQWTVGAMRRVPVVRHGSERTARPGRCAVHAPYSGVVGQHRHQRVTTTRVRGSGPAREEHHGHDDVIVEEPMWILLDGVLVATTMRTPGDDLELAVGFCFTEGLLDGRSLLGVDHATGGYDVNTVAVETTGGQDPVSLRLGSISSSCGWCGSAQIEELCSRLDPLPASAPIALDTLASVPGRVVPQQELFAATGAVHGAAVFDAGGDVTIVREDVGRHNAVDKVVGALLLGGGPLPATGLGLFVSGRASIEMVQKAWTAGFGTLLAMSAPTGMAVDAATRAGMQLVGFVRHDGFNVYTPAAHDV